MNIEEQESGKLLSEEEIMESIKIDDDTELITKSDKKIKLKKDIPTNEELNQMSDKEVIDLDSSAKELYDEFSSFLKEKTKITSEVIVRDLIPTGIDLFDAILGGGFPVGSLGIILGHPGCGKCLFYDEEIDVYIGNKIGKKIKINEEIEVYIKNELVKKRIKIGELFDLYSTDNTINNDIIKTKVPVYVENEVGEITKLEGVIRKTNCKLIELEFENNIKLKCASKHLIKVNNSFKFAEDIIINIDNVNCGNKFIKLLNRKIINENSYAYDISMNTNHVYKTPNNLYHHNSMICGKIIAQTQMKYNGKCIVAYLDSEEAVTTIRLSNLGVKNPKIRPYQDVTIEKIFKFLEGLCLFKEKKEIIDIPSLVIWDSIANTITQKEREVDDINSAIGLKARMLSILLPKYIAKMSNYKICLIAINQLRDKLSIGSFAPAKDIKMISSNKDMPGGQSLKFNAFHLAEMKISKVLLKTDPQNKFPFDGANVTVKLAKNKLFPPNIPIEVVGNFRTGFSNFWSNYNFLSLNKRLQVGAWNFLKTLPDNKFRTKDVITLYKSDNTFREAFDESVKEAIQTEIIEKNTIDDDDNE